MPSSTLALGVASCFILTTMALGLLPDPVVQATSGAATWHLRGTFAPEGGTSWRGAALA